MKKEKEEAARRKSKKGGKTSTFFKDERIKFILGILITGFAFYLLLACISYIISWKTDLSLPDSEVFSEPGVNVRNWSGKGGHFLAKMIIGFGFGFGAFFIPLIIGVTGLYLLNFPKINLLKLVTKLTLATILLSLILGFIFGDDTGYLSGLSLIHI